jgi:uncharacterized protein (DUF1015 family)
MIIKPFRGFRPSEELSDKVPSYPYDVIDSAEARELAAGDPHTFLHVVRPEIDLDPGIDLADEAVYAKGRENLHAMIEQGWLVRDGRPAYYVYRLQMGDHSQVGIVGASAVADYLEGRIKKHEHTRPAKVDDRVRLNDALSLHPGPVLLTYKGLPEINALVRGIEGTEADVRFVAPDGVEHALWRVDDAAVGQKIESLFSRVKSTYIADGHHRAAAAAAVSKKRHDESPDGPAEAPWNYFLTVLFPADQLKVLDYNRVVKDLNGLSPDAFLERVSRAGFDVEPDHRGKRPPHRETFGMYLNRRWYLLTAQPQIVMTDDVVERLDVSILTRTLLGPVLGIADLRTDSRIDFVGGIRGMEGLERRVDSGDAEVAFAVYPTSLEDVMGVADAGQVMPPKSTWFEPKLRSGMVAQSTAGESL